MNLFLYYYYCLKHDEKTVITSLYIITFISSLILFGCFVDKEMSYQKLKIRINEQNACLADMTERSLKRTKTECVLDDIEIKSEDETQVSSLLPDHPRLHSPPPQRAQRVLVDIEHLEAISSYLKDVLRILEIDKLGAHEGLIFQGQSHNVLLDSILEKGKKAKKKNKTSERIELIPINALADIKDSKEVKRATIVIGV
jgi:hypothetical protein